MHWGLEFEETLPLENQKVAYKGDIQKRELQVYFFFNSINTLAWSMPVWTTLPETGLRMKEWINILDASFRVVNLRKKEKKKTMVLSLVIYWKELTRLKEMEYHN